MMSETEKFKPWKILHIDLSLPLPALPKDDDFAGNYLVFWWQQIPLGKCQIWARELPLSAQQVALKLLPAIQGMVVSYLDENSEQPLATWAKALQAKEQSPQIRAAVAKTSVVVCTRDRPLQLAECLKSLQSLDSAPKEIIIVDNAPSDKATEQLVQQFPNIKYVLEPQPGLSFARNTGIQASSGDFIAFTDDDVRVHPQWLNRLQIAFADPQTLAVTGQVIPASLSTEAQVIFELGQGCLGAEYQPVVFDYQFFEATRGQGVPVWTVGAGANMAFRRNAFDQLGLFDTRLGAGRAGCSEDSEFWYRILAAQWKCRYEPTAVVYHEHRADLDRLNYQMHQYMRGHITALMVQFVNHRHWGNLYRIGFALPKHYLGLGLGAILKGRSVKHRTYWAEVTGCLAGISDYFTHR
jgi:glycosyltransferase involved in cell wall biosynthesis